MTEQTSVCFLTSAQIGEMTGLAKWVQDRMLVEKGDLQQRLAAHDIRTDIAVVMEWPDNREPTIVRAENPVIENDQVVQPHFRQTAVEALGNVVIDRYSERYGRPKPGLTPRTLNTFESQQFGYDKWANYQMGIGGTLIKPIPTYLLADIDSALAVFGAGPLIVKPRAGGEGKGMHSFRDGAALQVWLSKKYAATGDEQAFHQLLQRYLVQPEIDFTAPLQGLRPYSPADVPQMIERNDSSTPKEIGLYSFYDARTDTLSCFPVPRRNMRADISQRITPEWFFIDPEPLQMALYETAHADLQRIAKLTGALAVYGRKDYGFGSLPGTAEPQLFKIEDNLRGPYIMSTARHAEVGGKIRDMFVNLIAGLAQ